MTLSNPRSLERAAHDPSCSYDALRRSENEEKRQIARAAERPVRDDDSIFLEGSTTIFKLARRLIHRHRRTVVTNSPTIVCELQRSPDHSHGLKAAKTQIASPTTPSSEGSGLPLSAR